MIENKNKIMGTRMKQRKTLFYHFIIIRHFISHFDPCNRNKILLFSIIFKERNKGIIHHTLNLQL